MIINDFRLYLRRTLYLMLLFVILKFQFDPEEKIVNCESKYKIFIQETFENAIGEKCVSGYDMSSFNILTIICVFEIWLIKLHWRI